MIIYMIIYMIYIKYFMDYCIILWNERYYSGLFLVLTFKFSFPEVEC